MVVRDFQNLSSKLELQGKKWSLNFEIWGDSQEVMEVVIQSKIPQTISKIVPT